MVSEAHDRGLSVGLKNAVDLIAALEPSFDFAINEECLEYHECGGYQHFLDHNKVRQHSPVRQLACVLTLIFCLS